MVLKRATLNSECLFVFLKMLKTDTLETDKIVGEMMVPKSALGSGKVLSVAVFCMQR